MILEMKIMAILACMARMAQECLSRFTGVDDELRKGMYVEPRQSCGELER
jgi:hypothetical protein